VSSISAGRTNALEQFVSLLQKATALVPREYFQLPVDGSPKPVYRERVYCYELYHQLRSNWPDDYPFSLGGEVDKSGHPLLREGPLNQLKPDFVVHVPGAMTGNLIVVEVKPINARTERIRGDINSLNQFTAEAGYQLPIYLIYGGADDDLERFMERCHNSAKREGMNLEGIQLWWHPAPGLSARLVRWR